MFSYFGSKSKLISKYPTPKYRSIIEPFAGSARYACEYGSERNVWLNDSYDAVYRIWSWLVNASVADIQELPELNKGEDLRDITSLSDDERLLLGFCVGQCRNSPGNIYTGWAARDNQIGRTKKQLEELISKGISHWEVTNTDFQQLQFDSSATYFIDPPYQARQSDYAVRFPDSNYQSLKTYSETRCGQVIVCENSQATWWDFSPLTTQMGQRRPSNEVYIELNNGRRCGR